jgi:hypothetical protein
MNIKRLYRIKEKWGSIPLIFSAVSLTALLSLRGSIIERAVGIMVSFLFLLYFEKKHKLFRDFKLYTNLKQTIISFIFSIYTIYYVAQDFF